ncbi:MAG: C-type lectin domain-containing protein [Aquiluna sp.]
MAVFFSSQTAQAVSTPALSLPEAQTIAVANTFTDVVPAGNGDVLTGFSGNIRALLTVDTGMLRIGGGSTYDGTNYTLTVSGVTVDVPFGYRSSEISSSGTVGKPELALEGSASDVNAVLAELEFSRAAGTSTLTVSAVKSGANIAYSQDTGHYYEFVNSGITWRDARCAAKFDNGSYDANSSRYDKCDESNLTPRTFNGLTGYLATVTSQTENTFVTNKAGSSAAWIGGSDLAVTRTIADPTTDIPATEQNWRWVDGPEAGLIFWRTGCGTGVVTTCAGADASTQFSYWNSSEPNNSGGEEAVQLLSGGSGKWNDLPEDSSLLPYIVEYGGLSGETAIEEVTDTVSLSVALDGPPTAVTGSARDSAVTVSWTAPVIVTGTTVSSYTATSTPGGFTCTSSSTSCTVAGLTNGTAYTFVVTVTFADNNTRSSNASSSITPAVQPSTPSPSRSTATATTPIPTPAPTPTVPTPAPTPPPPAAEPPPAPEPPAVPEPEPLAVVEPEPEPLPEPELAPEPPGIVGLLSDPTQAVQIFTQVGQPTANAAIGASGDDSVIVEFDPMGSPEAVQATTNLVGATAAVAGVAAAAAGAASAAAAAAGSAAAGSAAASSAASSAAGASGGAASSGGTGAGGGGQAAPSAEMNEDVLDAMAGADFDVDRFRGQRKRWGDRLPIWRFWFANFLDTPSTWITRVFGPLSPLLSKLSNDATYLRAMFGPLALALPVVGVWIALRALQENEGVLLHPPVGLFLGLVALGIVDAFAGSLAMAVFVVGSLPLMDISAITDWRMLAGIVVAGFGPIFIARSIREFRRPVNREPGELMRRVGDIAFASLMGGWVAGLIIRSLPALTGLTLPAANYVFTFQLMATGVIALRIVLEDTAARHYPWRMDQLTPDQILEPPATQKIIAQTLRFWFYIFIASAFMGFGPVVWLAALLFMAPNLVGLFAHAIPNSRVLWRIMPTGIAGLAMMLALEIVLENSLGAALGDHPQFSVIFIFSLLGLIFVVSTLGMMAREGHPGESHWSESTRMGWLRRLGAVALFLALIQFTSML